MLSQKTHTLTQSIFTCKNFFSSLNSGAMVNEYTMGNKIRNTFVDEIDLTPKGRGAENSLDENSIDGISKEEREQPFYKKYV